MSNMATFLAIYQEELEKAVREHPEEYHFPIEQVPRVVARMAEAFERKSYNKDGFALRGTCTRLGIKHTYAAINAFIQGSEEHRMSIQKPLGPVLRLSCCCCGEQTRGRQWYNRDTGYGLCVRCADWIPAQGKTSPEEMISCYGHRGIHYDIQGEEPHA